MMRSVIGFGAAWGLTAAAAAQPYSVAIAAAASTSGFPNDCRWLDVQSKLLSTGLFSTVDLVDVNSQTPSLATLQQYDVVMTWSNGSYFDSAALGDVLADYVDAGGAVVVAVFANSTTTVNRFLTGRWSPTYEVIPSQSGTTTGSASLGSVLVPGHPIMAGVNTFNGGTSAFRPTTTAVQPGATRVAEWSDGKTLVAVGANPARVDLGMYPPSNACATTFWVQGTDGHVLMANALVFAASNAGQACYPDCDGNGALDLFDFLCFTNKFNAGDPYADCDGSGSLDLFDFLCFTNAFNAGCP